MTEKEILKRIGRRNFRFNMACEHCVENRKKLANIGIQDISIEDELDKIWNKIEEIEEKLNKEGKEK